ncbi:MAG TPA: glucan biosynthesis glucosyltransferase H, partial [Xanthomonadaceae bacterium]|nr:glucan biosynthesis glucosyltransferase H [Xanthomonadaceae bacterium]
MNTAADAALAAGAMPDAAAMMPPPAPLEMPEQSLHSGRLHNRRLPTTPRGMGWRRLYLFGSAGLMTALACYLMLDVLMADGVSVLDVLLLVLYVALFGWIALAFFSAAAGFCVMLFGRHRR